ncbi:MAG: flap endonuclease-1 [Halobacteria archaeon]
MGADIGDILEPEPVEFEDVAGKVGIDAFNAIYGFLANIRQRDGTPLQDSKGRVTSHLSGLLYKTANLYEDGVKPFYVFDGKPPDLKSDTVEKRRERTSEAEESYKEAKKKGDEAEMLKYAQQATSIESAQVESSIELLNALNVPWMEAPGEGEAQASYMCVEGEIDYVASQDYDALLFGALHLVRNLTISGRKGEELQPELIRLNDVLERHDLTREELVEMGILVGTDYNDGVHGIGAKTGLKKMKKMSFREILEDYGHESSVDLEKVKDLFMDPEVTDDYELEWQSPDHHAVVETLCDKYEFSEDRVEDALERIDASVSQSSLDRWG